ncbi:MAG: ExeM/NucH family extracellular endonuclease [Pseudolysinimonas sp.]|uniref:ExeM/NucH family extracellular endonuclease n=1 Tax=Pseudolysinimonas sp. TaxID=2680009 RepID=UPI003C72CA5E
MMRSPQRHRRAVTALAIAGTVSLTAALLPALGASAAPPTQPFIAELHYDNTGADAGEFVEVQIPAGGSSAGLSVVLYNGSNGQLYDTDALPGMTVPADAPAVAVVAYAGTLQNGSPDGVALVSNGTVLEFLSYEGALTAVDGPAAGMTSTDIGVAETGSDPVGFSLSRSYDPGADALVWSGPAAATQGVVNPTPDPEDPEDPATCEVSPTHEIGAVQGTGAATPIPGQQVTLRGVVVGDLPGLSGFYVQDPDGDGDTATSDGIFVFSPVDVGLGDTVAVTGGVSETFAQTQITSQTDVAVCIDGGAGDLPAASALDLPADDAARESLEGMLVQPADALTVSEVFDLTSFGELTLSEGGLLVQPTELARPGAEAQQIAAENALRRILLDDGSTARLNATTAPYLAPDAPVRVGDVVAFTEPLVLGFGFSAWRLQPADGTADGVFAPQNTRPATPDAVGGDLRVAAFNVLNYFVTFDPAVGRGARSAEQFELQAGKIVPAILALDAEVVALMEIEDTDSTGYRPGDADAALADLVARLNAAEGSGAWAYVPLPDELYAVDRDVIRNGIIYRSDVVQPVGDSVGLVDETVWDNAREPIAQTFVKDGDALTVIANHFKSKGSPAGATGDNADSGDGQAAWNGDRVRQAQSLAEFAAGIAEQTGDADILLMGDFNAYSREDPIVALEVAGYVDLGREFDPGRYSYVFDELSGSLDHALASQPLADKVTDAVHWNINAVESFAYQYSGDPELYAAHPYRSSDHDPVIVGIGLMERCAGLEPTIIGTDGDDALTGTNRPDVIMGLGGDDVIRGLNGADVICGGAGDDQISGGNGDDILIGGFGADEIVGGNGDDDLIGGPGEDQLVQGRGRGAETQGGPES